MGKLRKFLTWCRDAVPPLGQTHAERAVRAVTARAIKVDDALRAPHYYVFFYRSDQIRGGHVLPAEESGWRHPKLAMGPYKKKADATSRVRAEIEEYGYPRSQYKIRHLTADQYEEIWGRPPVHAAEGY